MNDFDKEIINIYFDKLAKEAKRNQEARQYAEDKRKREAIYKEITKDIKFVSKFTKKCKVVRLVRKQYSMILTL